MGSHRRLGHGEDIGLIPLSALTRRAGYGLFFVLFLAGNLACVALAADRPKSKGDLDPESRQTFDQLRDELRKASQRIEDVKKRAYAEDPLLLKAKEEVERARELEKATAEEKRRVDQFIASKPVEMRGKYRNWQRCYGEALDHDLFKAASQDPAFRPLFLYYANSMLKDLRQRKSEVLDSIRNEMPPPGATITPEQVMPLYLRMLERSIAESAPQLADLERQLAPPEFMREYVKNKTRADGLFLVSDTYFRLNMPEYVAQAEKESRRAANELIPQLDRIWPGWSEAEMKDSGIEKGISPISRDSRR